MKITFTRAIAIALLFITPIFSLAQIEPIGYYVDNSYNEITGFIDKDYEPEALYKCTVSNSSYLPGGYTDLNNVFHKGGIRVIKISNKISFNSNDSKDTLKLKAQNILSFIMAKDSFISVSNIITNNGVKPNGFMVKYLSNASFELYGYVNPKGIPSYHINFEGKMELVPKSKKNFKVFILPLIKEYQTLYDDVELGKFGYEDFDKIILMFDKYIHAKDKLPFYYSKNWEQIESRDEAFYYSTIEFTEGYRFNMFYFDMNSNKVLDITETFINESKKNGKFIWYYPNGYIKRESSFKAGKEIGITTEYSFEGKIHRTYGLNVDENKVYVAIFNSNGEQIFTRNGIEVFYDEVRDIELTRHYKEGKLTRSYYVDSMDRKIYQIADKNAKLRNSSLNRIYSNLEYPASSIKSIKEGLVLASLLIDPGGVIKNITVVRGIDFEIDSKVVQVFSSLLRIYESQFKPGIVDDSFVYQEILYPISFSFRTYDYTRQYYYDPMMFHMQDQMNQQMMFDMQMEHIQKYAPTFPTSY